LFLPATASGHTLADGPLPLTIFFHGYTATDPGSYLGWINHIARGGSIVFFPDYQGTDFGAQNPADYLPDAQTGIRAAVATLGVGRVPAHDPGRVRVVRVS
jgi:dipeptidyl aminopeptidase/acylaminoacyl peptidase